MNLSNRGGVVLCIPVNNPHLRFHLRHYTNCSPFVKSAVSRTVDRMTHVASPNSQRYPLGPGAQRHQRRRHVGHPVDGPTALSSNGECRTFLFCQPTVTHPSLVPSSLMFFICVPSSPKSPISVPLRPKPFPVSLLLDTLPSLQVHGRHHVLPI